MICLSCNVDKEKYEFVLPPSDSDNLSTNEICRKCYHLKQNINDSNYESFITIYKLCNEMINTTISIIEKTENDIKNNNMEKYNLGYTPEEFIESLHVLIERYNEMMRIVNIEMQHIKKWVKLINNI